MLPRAIFSAPSFWAYSLFQVPGGWLSERFGPRVVLACLVTFWSLMTAAVGLATGWLSFMVLLFLLGAGEAGAFPGATRAMQMWYPRRERGFARGLPTARAGSAPPLRRHYRLIIRALDRLLSMSTGARLALGVLSLRRGRHRLGGRGGIWSIATCPKSTPSSNRAELEHIRGVDARGQAEPGGISRKTGQACRGARCCRRPTCGRSCAPMSPTFTASDDISDLAAVLSDGRPALHPERGSLVVFAAALRHGDRQHCRRTGDGLAAPQDREVRGSRGARSPSPACWVVPRSSCWPRWWRMAIRRCIA